MILTKKIAFKTSIYVKVNSGTWMTLQSSVEIFQALEPLQLQWPLQPHIIKKILILMVGSSLAPKWSKLFVEWIIKHPIFYWYLIPFPSEASKASGYYFFEIWSIKLKFPNILKPLRTMIQQNYWSFYPSELIYFAFFTMRHPVVCLIPSLLVWAKIKCIYRTRAIIGRSRL